MFTKKIINNYFKFKLKFLKNKFYILILKIKILNILIPENTPILLVPLLITIESISYIARGISLGLRLGANMIAGHTLLKIIILFIYSYINMDINKIYKINIFPSFAYPRFAVYGLRFTVYGNTPKSSK